MKIRLNRIILFGRQIPLLKTFYQDRFGFKVIEEIDDEWAVLSAGEMEIALHRIGAAFDLDKDTPFKADSNTKLVFEMDEGLIQFREELLKNGLTIKELKTFESSIYQHFDGEDPEGNVFQIRQRVS